MWKKEAGMPTPQSQPGTAPQDESPKQSVSSSERATIGRSITIRGDVGGDEDLLIQGQVDGSVNLDLHSVTVGSQGRVNANITGRVVVVEGQVEGDLNAKEQIILRSSAHVMGDISGRRGRVLNTDYGDRWAVVHAQVPKAEVDDYAPALRSMTQGRGSFVWDLSGYEQMPADQQQKVVEHSDRKLVEEDD